MSHRPSGGGILRYSRTKTRSQATVLYAIKNPFLRGEFMLRKFSWVVALFFAATLTANAQSVNLFGGYSYERFRATPSVNTNGYEFSGEYKFMPWLGAMADFDGHYGSFGGVGFGVHDFLFGPQVSFPARISPFAHVLLGGAHFSSNGSGATSFSQGFGFGVDSKIAP